MLKIERSEGAKVGGGGGGGMNSRRKSPDFHDNEISLGVTPVP